MADNDNTPEPTDDDTQQGAAEPTEDNSATEDPQGDEGKLGTAGKAALEQERKARREAEKARREADRARRELEKQLQEFQDRDKSDTEKAVARAEGAEKRVAGLLQRAVRAEVRALATDRFADPEDAMAFLDLATYSDEEGEIDAAQIKADLADLLERKPHLAKKASEPERKRPAPDRTQASSANSPRSATPEDQFAGFVKSRLAKGR
ncbi:hypothetical protein [Sphaerisporangium sp. TRM90804]|uniref:hypothetical protein n=1 Tax=Sphaerisporangium sp. TRM90804 TaxID=3031113 RepID=UPI00244ABF63|nr:hypothetical protein [Sphaerisporangium sp. TRM90804]MDH2424742.1 hypothetical protein [Sphaerisporangium sp. TRM90804]